MNYIKRPEYHLKNERGFALISVLLILMILTFIGVAGTNTTVFELKIASNEKEVYQRFYSADSGWKQSGPYLNTQATPPDVMNLTLRVGDPNRDWGNEYYQIVRNYGNGVDGATNDAFAANSEDGSISNIPYWYRVRYESDSQALEFGANYRDFQYEVLSTAEGTTEVDTNTRKVYRIGY